MNKEFSVIMHGQIFSIDLQYAHIKAKLNSKREHKKRLIVAEQYFLKSIANPSTTKIYYLRSNWLDYVARLERNDIP